MTQFELIPAHPGVSQAGGSAKSSNENARRLSFENEKFKEIANRLDEMRTMRESDRKFPPVIL
jgi:hypothetical protein